MEKLHINLEKNSYEIYIEEGTVSQLSNYIGRPQETVLITDENVEKLYGKSLNALLKGRKIHRIVLPPGESTKTLGMAEKILVDMLEYGLTRNSLVIALGGGVVGDIAGFCASIYMRGIPYIQVPTTLLAQVDSSVGGKTGVNMPGGKNTVGSFYQPLSVVIDTGVLKTLPKRELINGIGEVIKYGIIYDDDFLTYIDENFDDILGLEEKVIKKVIKRCCDIKASIVAKDEKEQGIRKILNFGHTIGHALETLGNYEKYTHGEAVLIGMYYEALMAKKIGLIDDFYFQKITKVIKKTDVSLNMKKFTIKDLVYAMEKDKKNKEDKISFIFPVGGGKAEEKLLSREDFHILYQIIGGGDKNEHSQ